jgi:predicted metalloendopeptidase
MPLFTSLIVIFVFTVSLGTAAAPVDQKASTQDMDTSVKPGDDFYRYANGAGSERQRYPLASRATIRAQC